MASVAAAEAEARGAMPPPDVPGLPARPQPGPPRPGAEHSAIAAGAAPYDVV
jgi:hypothetical protein